MFRSDDSNLMIATRQWLACLFSFSVGLWEISVTKLTERSYGRGRGLYYSKSVSKLILHMAYLLKWSDQDCLCTTWRMSQILSSSPGLFLIVNDELSFWTNPLYPLGYLLYPLAIVFLLARWAIRRRTGICDLLQPPPLSSCQCGVF